MHEKRAREKEKRLLEQEKQLYQARIRSQVRAKLAGKPDPCSNPDTSSMGHGPMSPTDHIKALASRFMKEGAEDLWNEDDGPLKSPPPRGTNERPGSVGPNGRRGSIRSPIDLRKLISEGRENVNFTNPSGTYENRRNYSGQSWRRFRRNESSESEDEDEDDYGPLNESPKPFARNLAGNRRDMNSKKILKISGQRPRLSKDENSGSGSDFEGESVKYFGGSSSRWPRLSVGGGEEEENAGIMRDRERGVRKVGSSASLGKYDVKIKKRVPLQSLEEEVDFPLQVELIRHQLSKKSLVEENGGEKRGEESILSQKRYNVFLIFVQEFGVLIPVWFVCLVAK